MQRQGIVSKKKILGKNKVRSNNIILGIPSSGIHSNGFSLVRYLLKRKKINLKKNKFLNQVQLKDNQKKYIKSDHDIIEANSDGAVSYTHLTLPTKA